MTNPFKCGTVVSGGDFTDRESETKELTAKLQETARIFLLAAIYERLFAATQTAAALKSRLLTATDSMQIYNLEFASNVDKSLKALCKKGILRKEKKAYVFEDVFFSRWAETITRNEQKFQNGGRG